MPRARHLEEQYYAFGLKKTAYSQKNSFNNKLLLSVLIYMKISKGNTIREQDAHGTPFCVLQAFDFVHNCPYLYVESFSVSNIALKKLSWP
jgi:hypothetical protein